MNTETLHAPAVDRGTVDADNPWPGLVPFNEADQRYFRGRGREIEALARCVERDRLTVLFGTSGLGKSSLLKAGLFPRLRQRRILPVYIRLDHSEDGSRPLEQIIESIQRQATLAGAEVPTYRDGESLWEYSHRRGGDFWGPRNRPLKPLLVFDQFEELFTLGRRSAASKAAGRSLIQELAWLVEGRPPPSVQQRLEAEPDLVAAYDFSRHSYKVLITLREDFLAELEELRDVIPSLARNRLRLHRMDGRAALRVVWLGAPRLIDLDLAEPLVRFVAKADDDEELDALRVEPALLSVVCRRLNNKRREKGAEKIDARLLAGAQESILEEFYEDSIRDLGPRVRRFVEDRLLTIDDHRDSMALGNALGRPGITQEAIDTLVSRRLLRIERSAGAPRVELTHDLLVKAIAASRARRKQRRARFGTWSLAALAVVALALVVLIAGWLVDARQRARDERRMRVAAELAGRNGETALAVLLELEAPVSSPRDNPPALFPALASALGGELEADLTETVDYDSPSRAPLTSPDGSRIAAIDSAHSIRVEPGDGKGRPLVLEADGSPVLRMAFSFDGRRIAAGYGDGTTRIWSTEAEEEAQVLAGSSGPVLAVAFSRDGGLIAAGSGSGVVRVWATDGGGEPLVLRGHQGPVHAVAFSPDGTRVVSASEDDTARVWSSADGALLDTLPSDDDVWSAAYSPDGGRIVTASSDGTVRVWNALQAAEAVVHRGHEGAVVDAAFTPGGTRILSASVDGTARLWRSDGFGQPVVLRAGDEPLAKAVFTGDEIRASILTASRAGTVRVWPAAFDTIRESVRALTGTCLDSAFRQRSLGEKPGVARRNHARCLAALEAPEVGS